MRKLSEVAKMWLDKLHNFINATAHAELSAAVDRLAAYESLGTVEELAALKEAKDDGRLVVLPCKVGDKVYEVAKGLSIYKSGLHPYVHEHIATELNVFDWERQKDFGKTVFLTRAEAEKALGKAQDER